MAEPEENFVITIPSTLVDTIVPRIKPTLNAYRAVSTGNQFGCGVAEYFFAVDPKRVNGLRRALINKVNNPQITFELMK